jgi:hypothetical protein
MRGGAISAYRMGPFLNSEITPLFLSGKPEVIACMIVFTASAEPCFGSSGTMAARGRKTTL